MDLTYAHTTTAQLKELAFGNDDKAQLALAIRYLGGHADLAADVDEAVRWFGKSAAQNNSFAPEYLAAIDWLGLGEDDSGLKSLEKMRAAAETGKVADQFKLAQAYTQIGIYDQLYYLEAAKILGKLTRENPVKSNQAFQHLFHLHCRVVEDGLIKPKSDFAHDFTAAMIGLPKTPRPDAEIKIDGPKLVP